MVKAPFPFEKGKKDVPSGGLTSKKGGMKPCKKCKPGTMHPADHPHFK